MIAGFLVLAIGGQISVTAQFQDFGGITQPMAKVAALQPFKVKTIKRSKAWFSPGYYSLQFVYDVDRNKVDKIRKQLPSENFEPTQTTAPKPTMFWRDQAKLKQIADIPIPSKGYSDLVQTESVSLYEHPLGPAGMKAWPKALLDPTPPLSKKDIYPYPFLSKLELLSVELGGGDQTYSTVYFTSPLPPEALAKKVEPVLAKDWNVIRGRNMIRFVPKGRLKPGPFQVDLQRLVTSGTRVMVVSRGIAATSKG